jgi:hypothetical protein
MKPEQVLQQTLCSGYELITRCFATQGAGACK